VSGLLWRLNVLGKIKRCWGISFLLLLGACTGAGGLSTSSIYKPFPNEPTGFRGIAWGTPLSAVQSQMTPFSEPSPGLGQAYERKGDAMTLGGATLKHVQYHFYNGGFSRAYLISIARPDQPPAMIAAFKAQYGEGAKPNQFMDDYLWNGPVGSVYLTCSSVTHECLSFIASTATLKQDEADKAAAAARGKKDF
jgi:hypothetical protein